MPPWLDPHQDLPTVRTPTVLEHFVSWGHVVPVGELGGAGQGTELALWKGPKGMVNIAIFEHQNHKVVFKWKMLGLCLYPYCETLAHQWTSFLAVFLIQVLEFTNKKTRFSVGTLGIPWKASPVTVSVELGRGRSRFLGQVAEAFGVSSSCDSGPQTRFGR